MLNRIKKEFLASLLGIETKDYLPGVYQGKQVFSVPIRDWNLQKFLALPQTGCAFLASLLGIETKDATRQIDERPKVFSVPIRDWNYVRRETV